MKLTSKPKFILSGLLLMLSVAVMPASADPIAKLERASGELRVLDLAQGQELMVRPRASTARYLYFIEASGTQASTPAFSLMPDLSDGGKRNKGISAEVRLRNPGSVKRPSFAVAAIPEPGSMLLLGTGLLGLGAAARKRYKGR